MRPLIFLLICIGLVLADPKRGGNAKGPKQDDESRKGKLFSLFNVVKFANTACMTQSTFTSPSGTGSIKRAGTCYSSSQCSTLGGAASGNCAAGFGVCCLFTASTSGSVVNQNCTFLRNPGFPTAYTGAGVTTTTPITYTIQKTSSVVCSLRLDFEAFTLLGTTATSPVVGPFGTCVDFMTATTTSALQLIPQICGVNTGQHIYIDVGNVASDTATLSFTISTKSSTTFARTWEIKVTQIICSGPGTVDNKPPLGSGCLQYFTGQTGTFSTFNFIPGALPPTDNYITGTQDYSICVRQEQGFCCVEYQPCAVADAFSIAPPAVLAMVDSQCTGPILSTFVGISGASGSCNLGQSPLPIYSKFCGGIFSTGGATAAASTSVCDCLSPFVVDIVNSATATAGPNKLAGVCLTYNQVPCSS